MKISYFRIYSFAQVSTKTLIIIFLIRSQFPFQSISIFVQTLHFGHSDLCISEPTFLKMVLICITEIVSVAFV